MFGYQNKTLESPYYSARIKEANGTSALFLFCFQNKHHWAAMPGIERELIMDVLKMLADLRQEREQIEEAIVTLERLARGRVRRRGRPPAWMAAIKRRGRPPGSKNKSKESMAA